MQNSARKFFKPFIASFSGYSLIELLVAIATMVIIFSVGIANFRGYQRRQNLENAFRMVKADLMLTRELALTAKFKEGCNVLNGYLFRIDASTDEYIVGADCGPGNTCVNKPNLCEKKVSLPDNIDISLNAGNTILFKTVAGGINWTSNALITLSDENGNSKIITVTPQSRIE